MLGVLLQFFRRFFQRPSDTARAPLLLGDQGPGKLQSLYLWIVQRICQICGSTDNRANGDSALSVPPPSPPPAPPPVPPERVVWASIDPVHGNLQVYPHDVAVRIEQALSRGEASVELNHFHASVHFYADGPGRHLQRTAGGRRDVCRLSPRSEDGLVSVSIHCPGRAWRLLSVGEPMVTPPLPGIEIRTADPGGDAFDVTEAEISTADTTGESPQDISGGHAHAQLENNEIPSQDPPSQAVEEVIAHVVPEARAPSWVVWVSVDPRQGRLDVYPSRAARLLEGAKSRGDSSVCLGADLFNATVILEDEAHIQRTTRGRRDVRRLLLDDASQPMASLHVACGPHGWRVAAQDVPGAEERNVRVSPEDLVSLHDSPEVASASEQAPACDDLGNDTNAVGRLPLWEWCREDGVHPVAAQQLPATAWGVYSREQNSAIEEAFQAGQEDLSVSVGIRTYRIVFGPEAGFARQVDDTLHKRRLIRRRLLDSSEERDQLLEPAAPQIAREQESCPICFMDFAETPAMPVLELPGCKHVFHMACAQQLADSGSQCPCCRGDVDWAALGTASRGRRRP